MIKSNLTDDLIIVIIIFPLRDLFDKIFHMPDQERKLNFFRPVNRNHFGWPRFAKSFNKWEHDHDLDLTIEKLLVNQRSIALDPVSYTHLRAHETPEHLVC